MILPLLGEGMHVRCSVWREGGSSIKTITHLHGTQPKPPRPPLPHSLCPPPPTFLPGTLSSACFPSSLRFPPPPPLYPASHFPLSLFRHDNRVEIQCVIGDRRWGEQVAQSEGSHSPVHAGTSGVQALGHRGCRVVPSGRSRAWEGLAARNADNLSCRLQVPMYVWAKQSSETAVCVCVDVLYCKSACICCSVTTSHHDHI